MLQKRFEQDHEDLQDTPGTLAALETARSAGNPPVIRGKHDDKKEEEKISLFWRVFGGTILSIVALVFITLYNNLTSSINDLRGEVGREREAMAGMAKKDDLDREREARTLLAKKDDIDARIKSQYERIRTIEGYKGDIEAVKERTTSTAAAVEAMKKDLGGTVEGLKKDASGMDALKEKLLTVSADLKAAKDEVQRLNAEVEKNKSADLERKTFRDSQAKQLDETIKELQKGVQVCREKIARLEGGQPGGPPKPKTDTPRVDE